MLINELNLPAAFIDVISGDALLQDWRLTLRSGETPFVRRLLVDLGGIVTSGRAKHEKK